MARDRADSGNERTGASRRTETIGESAREGKAIGPFFSHWIGASLLAFTQVPMPERGSAAADLSHEPAVEDPFRRTSGFALEILRCSMTGVQQPAPPYHTPKHRWGPQEAQR
jgi:hypothetical protein